MALASSRVRRLEREAILRTKEFDHKREQSSYLLTNDYRDAEDEENDRHRRFDIIRQTRQIQREIDHQVGAIEKRNERKKHELEKKLNSPLNPRPPSPTTPAERAFRTATLMEKYSSKRQQNNTTTKSK